MKKIMKGFWEVLKTVGRTLGKAIKWTLGTIRNIVTGQKPSAADIREAKETKITDKISKLSNQLIDLQAKRAGLNENDPKFGKISENLDEKIAKLKAELTVKQAELEKLRNPEKEQSKEEEQKPEQEEAKKENEEEVKAKNEQEMKDEFENTEKKPENVEKAKVSKTEDKFENKEALSTADELSTLSGNKSATITSSILDSLGEPPANAEDKAEKDLGTLGAGTGGTPKPETDVKNALENTDAIQRKKSYKNVV